MENANSFRRFWTDEYLIEEDEGHALEDVRRRIMEIVLANPSFHSNHFLGVNDIINACFNIFEALLLWGKGVGNGPVDRLRETSAPFGQNPVFMIAVALDKWYQSAASIVNRDPNHGLPSQSEALVNRALNLNADSVVVDCRDRLGNLGLLGILLTLDSWVTPSSSTFRTATLITNAACTILVTASLLLPAIPVQPLSPTTDTNHCLSALTLLLQTAWRLARDGPPKAQWSPGIEFGATEEEVKISHDGRRLLCRIGIPGWKEAPYWHPCRVSPGSPWGKFIRNYLKPTFAEPDGRLRLLYRLPSSASALTLPFETYYSDLRARFDQVGRHRVLLSRQELEAQYTRLAEKTGQLYAAERPSREVALTEEDVSHQIKDILPMAKKPITDNAGTLTIPYLSTAARAFRFEFDPYDMEPGFSIMTLRI